MRMSQDGDAWTLEMREVHDVRGMIARFFCALVGVVCITLGVSWIDTNRDLLQHGIRTTGVDLASLVAAVWEFAARNTPAAYRRRMLKLLHRLGGATLVWDAYEGGLIIRTYRNEDGTWELLKIGGLHLLDMAGNPVPLPTAWRV